MKKICLNLSNDNIVLIASILFLTILFGFNDNSKTFIASKWFSNLILIFTLTAIVVLFNYLGLRLAANYFGDELHLTMWGLYRFRMFKERKKKMKPILPVFFLTPIFPFLVMLISNGTFPIPLFHTFTYKIKQKIGNTLVYLEERQVSFISIISMLFSLLLLSLFYLLNIEQGVLVSTWFIFWNLLPLTDNIGSKIFFGSKTLYFFFFIFTAVYLVLIHYISLWALLIALPLAGFVAYLYFVKMEL